MKIIKSVNNMLGFHNLERFKSWKMHFKIVISLSIKSYKRHTYNNKRNKSNLNIRLKKVFYIKDIDYFRRFYFGR